MEHLWIVSPVGLDKLQDMEWASSLVAAAPVVLGVCLLPSHSWQAGGNNLQLQLQCFIQMPGVMEKCKNHQSLLTLPHRQREVGGGWVRSGTLCAPRQGSSGSHSFLQAMGRSQSLPTGCVQHGSSMFPGSKSQNANFQSKNGLRWGKNKCGKKK